MDRERPHEICDRAGGGQRLGVEVDVRRALQGQQEALRPRFSQKDAQRRLLPVLERRRHDLASALPLARPPELSDTVPFDPSWTPTVRLPPIVAVPACRTFSAPLAPRPTVALALLFQSASSTVSVPELESITMSDSADFSIVMQAIHETGALEYTHDAAQAEAQRAASLLAALPDSPHKQTLLQLCAFAVERRS